MPEAMRRNLLDWFFGSREVRTSRENPYQTVIDEIKEIQTRPPGWNGARAARVADAAAWRAIGFVYSLSDLGVDVPPPSVAPTPNGGVAIRWLTRDREVEIIFLDSGGEYTVAKRGSEDALQSGFIGHIDLLKDVVEKHIVGH
jgi:hypothetical protein